MNPGRCWSCGAHADTRIEVNASSGLREMYCVPCIEREEMAKVPEAPRWARYVEMAVLVLVVGLEGCCADCGVRR